MSGSSDGSVKIWGINKGVVKIIDNINLGYFHCAAFSPDNKHLLIYQDNIIQVRRIRGIMQHEEELEQELTQEFSKNATAFSLLNSAYELPLHPHLIKNIMECYKTNQMGDNWG
jgi:WD40 repeat protein